MTVEITPELLSDLKAKARAAMSGPWRVDTLGSVMASDGQFVALTTRYAHRRIPGMPNADHIAAASPDVVLSLIEAIRLQRGVCEYLADSAHKFCRKIRHTAWDGCFSCPLQFGPEYGRIDFCDSPLEAARKAVGDTVMHPVTIPSPEVIHQNAKEHGWYDGVALENIGPDFIPSKLALIHSELSEALEAYRKQGIPKPGDGRSPGEDSFTEELADAVIRIFDLCGFLGVDIGEAIRRKHEYNKTRPYRHGSKVV